LTLSPKPYTLNPKPYTLDRSVTLEDLRSLARGPDVCSEVRT